MQVAGIVSEPPRRRAERAWMSQVAGKRTVHGGTRRVDPQRHPLLPKAKLHVVFAHRETDDADSRVSELDQIEQRVLGRLAHLDGDLG